MTNWHCLMQSNTHRTSGFTILHTQRQTSGSQLTVGKLIWRIIAARSVLACASSSFSSYFYFHPGVPSRLLQTPCLVKPFPDCHGPGKAQTKGTNMSGKYVAATTHIQFTKEGKPLLSHSHHAVHSQLTCSNSHHFVPSEKLLASAVKGTCLWRTKVGGNICVPGGFVVTFCSNWGSVFIKLKELIK